MSPKTEKKLPKNYVTANKKPAALKATFRRYRKKNPIEFTQPDNYFKFLEDKSKEEVDDYFAKLTMTPKIPDKKTKQSTATRILLNKSIAIDKSKPKTNKTKKIVPWTPSKTDNHYIFETFTQPSQDFYYKHCPELSQCHYCKFYQNFTIMMVLALIMSCLSKGGLMFVVWVLVMNCLRQKKF